MQIGEFYVLGELGRGAMAVVYHARSMRTGVDVALKLLAPGKNPRQQERFRREAEALMILNHPNIVGVHGFGEFNGSLYMAMELIPGEGLDERIERLGPLPVGYAVELFVPLAKALGHAHERRILHRDLKPANVLISAAGKPYLADFGLAKDADSQGADLTMEGALVGTPGFWSPEQALADHANVGPATDVYGLGATLYAALTGKAPFTGESLTELVVAVQDKVPTPPAKLRPEVPRGLSAVCMRCLEKKPKRRYPSANALAKALAESLYATSSQRSSRRGLALQLALAVGVSVGAAWWLTRGPAEGSQETQATTEVAPPPPPTVQASREQLLERGKAALDEEDALAAEDAFVAVLQLDPDDPVALIGMGEAALLRDDFHTGIDYLSRGLEVLPEDTRALISRGIGYAKLERWEEARSDFELAVSLDPKDPRALRNLGMVHTIGGDLRTGLDYFDKAVALSVENDRGKALLLLNRAIAYVQLGEFTKAEPDVRASMAIDPELDGSHYLLAICLYQAKNWEAAAVAFEDALERFSPSDPRYEIAQQKLATCRARLGR